MKIEVVRYGWRYIILKEEEDAFGNPVVRYLTTDGSNNWTWISRVYPNDWAHKFWFKKSAISVAKAILDNEQQQPSIGEVVWGSDWANQ